MKAWQYKPMIVAYRNGAAVRLSDVANVIDSVQDDKQFAMLYGGEYGNGRHQGNHHGGVSPARQQHHRRGR
jgi:hypothetical protein